MMMLQSHHAAGDRRMPTPAETNFPHIGVDPIEFSRSCFLRGTDLQLVEFVVVRCESCAYTVPQTIKLGRDD